MAWGRLSPIPPCQNKTIMKQIKQILCTLVLSALTLSMSSCSSDEETPIDAKPSWTPKTPAEASVNMTVYVQVTSNLTLGENDIMAAFVGDECRAIGVPTDNRTYVLTIKGVADEKSKVTLRFYNEQRQRIYTDDTKINFQADDVIGLEEPYVFKIK